MVFGMFFLFFVGGGQNRFSIVAKAGHDFEGFWFFLGPSEARRRAGFRQNREGTGSSGIVIFGFHNLENQ